MLDNIFTIVSLFVLIRLLFQSYICSTLFLTFLNFSIFSVLHLSYFFIGSAGQPEHSFYMSVKEVYCSGVFTIGCSSWCQPHAWEAVSNSSKLCIMSGTH